MNIVGICGSPRPNSNSEHLLANAIKPFIEAGWKSRILKLSELSVLPCRACDNCLKNDQCIITQDDMHQFYDSFLWCNAIIVSTPVFYRNISSKLMAVFERHYATKRLHVLDGKPGGAISVGRSSSGGGQAIAITIINNWLLSCGAICVPGELNSVTASADKAGDILSQTKRLDQAYSLGKNVLTVAEKLLQQP